MRSEIEMRNMLLETEEKVNLVIKWELGWIVLCCSVLWNIELVRDEIGYLTEEISKKIVKGLAWPHLTTHSKM